TVNPIQVNNGGANAFVSVLDNTGARLAFSTLLGGTGTDNGASAVAVDVAGNAYVVGATQSTDFPAVNAFQATYAQGKDASVLKITGIPTTPPPPPPPPPPPGPGPYTSIAGRNPTSGQWLVAVSNGTAFTITTWG